MTCVVSERIQGQKMGVSARLHQASVPQRKRKDPRRGLTAHTVRPNDSAIWINPYLNASCNFHKSLCIL